MKKNVVFAVLFPALLAFLASPKGSTQLQPWLLYTLIPSIQVRKHCMSKQTWHLNVHINCDYLQIHSYISPNQRKSCQHIV